MSQQSELDRVQRAIKALEEREQIAAQMAEGQTKLNELMAQLNGKMANVDANTRKMVEEMLKGQGGKTAFEKFMDGLKIPDDRRGDQPLPNQPDPMPLLAPDVFPGAGGR
jgi:beta-phosphoglucomutase-like phosphatase (HAD superfamily)